MKRSQFFIPTTKEAPSGAEAISHQLSLRSGLVHMLTSGVYSYLPLGLRVLRNVENIIREEMDAAGANELFLPCLQPMELWQETGRDKTLSEVMIAFKDNKGKDMCLGPTHEEVITSLAKDFIQSYRQLPVNLYQIQSKFRDEIRVRFGIVRACEFIMKDAYSFDRDKEGLQKSYEAMFEAYKKIFQRCGVNPIIVEADSGAMGGDVSHEFLVPAPIGEDTVKDDQGVEHQAIEIGHIFQLGTKYSSALNAVYLDEQGKQQPMIMGCYGIGVSRLLATIIEVSHDDKGIIWPAEVAPFNVEILPLQTDNEEVMKATDSIYHELTQAGLDVLVDDLPGTAGRKFNDADLMGIPYQVIIGAKSIAQGEVEVKTRATGNIAKVTVADVASHIK